MNKTDRAHIAKVVALGCIACRLQGTPGTPAEAHHPRSGVGMGQKASHGDVLALCSHHHRGTDHPRTPSIHLDKNRFIERFGTEAELLEMQRRIVAKFDEMNEGF